MLHQLESFLCETVNPIAHLLDKDSDRLHEIFNQLKTWGLLKLHIPREHGGFELNSRQYAQIAISIAKCSGALNLLHSQHQRAVSYFNMLKLHGQYQCIIDKDISFAYYNAAKHISALTVIQDQTIQGAFRLTGTLPWVTGFNLLNKLFLSFRSGENKYFAILPFENITQDNGAIHCSLPIKLRALSSANNVSITLNNWLIKPDSIIAMRATNENFSPAELSSPPFMFVACVEVALEHIQASRYFNRETVQQHFIPLQKRLACYKETVLAGGCGKSITELRAQGYPIVRDALELSRITCGAKILLEDHPIGRISMEIWQSITAGPREGQLDAYLNSG